jgi:hypothetical protein
MEELPAPFCFVVERECDEKAGFPESSHGGRTDEHRP